MISLRQLIARVGISSPYPFEPVSPVMFYRGPCINLLDIVRVIGAYLMRINSNDWAFET